MQAAEEKDERKANNFTLFFVMAILQIGRFLWYFSVPVGGEFPSQTVVAIVVFFDIGITIGIIGMGLQIWALPRDDPRRTPYQVLFWVALFACICLFPIRFNQGFR